MHPSNITRAPAVRTRPYPGQVGEARTYEIRTYGCQMNVHDSERVAGLLEDAGYEKAAAGQTPDLVVFNTCAVRENAADRLYGNLGHLLPAKKAHAGMQIAVGGCLAQMERQKITDRPPWPRPAAPPPPVRVLRLGLHLGRLQQHLHLLHRPGAARQGEGPPSRR